MKRSRLFMLDDANPVGRYRVEDASPTDGVVAGTAGKVAGTTTGAVVSVGVVARLGWWLKHLEWMPTRLDGAGWKMRTLPMGTVREIEAAPGAAAQGCPC